MIEPAEPPHHHHHRTGIRWFDLIMPLAVLTVSIASLLTSLHSEKSMEALVEQNRRLVHAQSTPLLTYDTGNDRSGKPVITMTLTNVGTGPAEVYWFHAADAQGLNDSGGALTARVLQLDPHSRPESQEVSSVLMRSGEDRSIFAWPRPTGNQAALAEWEKLNHDRFHLKMSACYCSMFEECRITDFSLRAPKAVTSCEQGGVQS